MWGYRCELDLEPWRQHGAGQAEFNALLQELLVERQLGSPEPELLFSLSFRAGRRGAIVELGTNVGTSLLALTLAQRLNGVGRRVTTIDLQRRADVDRNLARAGLADLADVVVRESTEAAQSWTEPIELLWIDADHRYAGCLADIVAWRRHVLPGGLIALHDYADGMGVWKAVYEGLLAFPWLYRVASDRDYGNIFVIEKIAAENGTPAWEDRLTVPGAWYSAAAVPGTMTGARQPQAASLAARTMSRPLAFLARRFGARRVP